MVIMFEKLSLHKNLYNTKALIYTLGFIWGKHGAEAYKQIYTGEGTTFWKMKRTRVSCEVCGGTMFASSLRHHTERAHGRVLPHVRGVDIGGGGLEVYKVLFPRIIK